MRKFVGLERAEGLLCDGGLGAVEDNIMVKRVIDNVAQHHPLGAVAFYLSLRGLTCPDIAAELKIPLTTVENAKADARTYLQARVRGLIS